MKLIAAAIVALFCSVCSGGSAFALPDRVSVTLFGAHPNQQKIFLNGPVWINAPVSKALPMESYFALAKGGRVSLFSDKSARTDVALISGKKIAFRGTRMGLTPDGLRYYKGDIVLTAHGDRVVVTNIVPARDYVASVVGSETLREFVSEQLKAQSVLTQTLLARYKLGDPLNDTTETQAYLGADQERAIVRAAVDATWGQILEYDHRPARIYFHSTCAGGTSDGAKLFELDGRYPYLKGQTCSFCKPSPFWKSKTVEIPAGHWRNSFGSAPVAVESRDNRDRPLRVRVGSKDLNGYTFWMQMGQKLGWDKVPGTRYSIASKSGKVVLSSSGAGHGVGMCQWGANQMAIQGKTYREILQYYFPGTRVRTMK